MPDEVAALLRQVQPRLVFVCNPNNPTGALLAAERLAGWAAQHPHTLFVVDEAYHFFAPGFRSMLAVRAANILVVRSMTKDYALAGLRLGYAAGAGPVVTAISRVRPAWNVNAFAQAAGLAALADETYQQACLDALLAAKAVLLAGLEKSGLAPLPSAVHFFLVQVGDAAAFRQALLRQGILVRDCASFGLPAYVRIATRRPEENARLLAAVAGLRLPLIDHMEADR
jgi:histidinol-phosphate aminotransferase